MAPPPRARPPPTSAPAMRTALAMSSVFVAINHFLLGLLMRGLECRVVIVARREGEVQDRQQHENISLDQPNEEVERLPDELTERRDEDREQRDHHGDHES